MRLENVVPAKLRGIGPEAVKFAVVGGANTVLNFLVFNLLMFTVFTTGELKAKVVATVVATVASYFMNRHWTYRDRDKSAAHREFMLFIFFNAAGLAIELSVLGLVKYGFGLTGALIMNVAAFLGLLLGTVFRFFTYRRFVFTHAPEPALAGVPSQFSGSGDAFEQLTAHLEAEFAQAGKKSSGAPRSFKKIKRPART